jgi:hypothetical protein
MQLWPHKLKPALQENVQLPRWQMASAFAGGLPHLEQLQVPLPLLMVLPTGAPSSAIAEYVPGRTVHELGRFPTHVHFRGLVPATARQAHKTA